jgi:hypothetical protein
VTLGEAPDPRMPRVVDAVLEATRPPPRRRRLAFALVTALLVHAGALAAALVHGDSLEPWALDLAARIHDEFGRETVVETAPPPAPPPSEKPPPPPREQPAPSSPHVAARPPPPAQAGQVIARAPGADEPRDLTADTFVTGTASAYAGGVTSSSGTSPRAVESRVVDPASPPSANLSRPVGLTDVDWSDCGWPTIAQSSDLDQAIAVIRVVVREDGVPSSARVVRDPGMGFGDLAVSCALRKRYPPAQDAAGRSIAALSPPINVRFTR